MFSLETVIIIGFACYCIGALSTLLLSKKGLTIAQVVAVIFLAFWMALILLSTFVEFEVSIFVHSAGIASLGTLLGIETSEMLSGLIKKRK